MCVHRVCVHAGWTGAVEGKAIERELQKGGGLRRKAEDPTEQNFPYSGQATCLIERFPYPAKVQEEEASLCASQDSDLVGQRRGPLFILFNGFLGGNH